MNIYVTVYKPGSTVITLQNKTALKVKEGENLFEIAESFAKEVLGEYLDKPFEYTWPLACIFLRDDRTGRYFRLSTLGER